MPEMAPIPNEMESVMVVIVVEKELCALVEQVSMNIEGDIRVETPETGREMAL
jgi:hypothetical protein